MPTPQGFMTELEATELKGSLKICLSDSFTGFWVKKEFKLGGIFGFNTFARCEIVLNRNKLEKLVDFCKGNSQLKYVLIDKRTVKFL